MTYKQCVLIKNVDIKTAKTVFSDERFINYLIALQPVNIIKWDGIFDGAKAHMRFWFFGWRDFKVVHRNNVEESDLFSFEDFGLVLPFGLTEWVHQHKVIKDKNNIKIIDDLTFTFSNSITGLFFYPILVFPIVIRKILYKTYDWNS